MEASKGGLEDDGYIDYDKYLHNPYKNPAVIESWLCLCIPISEWKQAHATKSDHKLIEHFDTSIKFTIQWSRISKIKQGHEAQNVKT